MPSLKPKDFHKRLCELQDELAESADEANQPYGPEELQQPGNAEHLNLCRLVVEWVQQQTIIAWTQHLQYGHVRATRMIRKLLADPPMSTASSTQAGTTMKMSWSTLDSNVADGNRMLTSASSKEVCIQGLLATDIVQLPKTRGVQPIPGTVRATKELRRSQSHKPDARPDKAGGRIKGTLGDIDPLNKVPLKRARSRVQKGYPLRGLPNTNPNKGHRKLKQACSCSDRRKLNLSL